MSAVNCGLYCINCMPLSQHDVSAVLQGGAFRRSLGASHMRLRKHDAVQLPAGEASNP